MQNRLRHSGFPSQVALSSGGIDWDAYWANLSLFYLDGTIIDEGGAKYFKDISGSGRNFLITNYDFDSTWTKGFPYKSAATISAPVGDATLIAEDVNNFLYDIGGTPNEISVVSLFQNIDYADKIFCTHIVRVIDGNGVEITEPHVLKVFMAADTLSTEDLISAYSYFGAESYTTGICVSPNGNDITGEGTLTNPYLTLSKALTAVGTQVIMMTGNYNMGGAQTSLTKNIKGTGLVKITNFSNVYGFNANYRTVKGLWFSHTGNVVFYVDKTATISNCRCENIVQRFVQIQGGTTVTIQDCIININGTTSRTILCRNTNPTIIGNLFVEIKNGNSIDLAIATSVAVVKYNKFKGTVTSSIYPSSDFISVDIFNNKFYNNAYVNSAPKNGNSTLQYNYVISTGANYLFRSTGGTGTVLIENNIVNTGNAYAIYSFEQNITVRNNIVNVNGVGAAFLYVTSTTNAIAIDISNNRAYNAENGNMLIIGTEGSAMLNKISGTIKNNRLIGSGAGNAIHGIFIWGHSDLTIKNNFVSDCALAFVIKGNSYDYTNTKILYNLFINGYITIKGACNANFYGNTCYNGGMCVTSIPNGANASTGNVFKNNLFKRIGIPIARGVFTVDAGESFTADYDLMYADNPPYGIVGANTYNTFGDWQTAGFDVNGVNNDPALDSNYVPAIAIEGADNLGIGLDEGLDVLTNWGSANAVPSIVIKNQVDNWQIGAYIH